ncbi:hypothetical protein BGZ61DRAFT_368682, partial [Ilyonectria robusta]|uniref:uncharacterized protein n=1 Tax=Ilyonectria robusta TaxID=1079257 RepID=UPI001E8EC15E
ETMKRVLGEEHSHTLSSMANLASTFWSQGRWKEAEELALRVMETRKSSSSKSTTHVTDPPSLTDSSVRFR